LRYYLPRRAALKWLELPSLYDIGADELYDLDEEGFVFLQECAGPDGGDPQKADAEFAEYCLSEGLLTRERIITARPPLVRSRIPSLRYLELQITDKCNLKCRHCFVGAPQNRELTLQELRRVLDEFETMQGLRLLISGGEPLAHSRFREFNALLPDYAFRKILFSNGLLLTSEIIKSLSVDEVQLSIDGMEHGHDTLRGQGSFRKVMKALDMLSESGMTVSVATMAHTENIKEFEEMKALFFSRGIRDWTVDVPCPEGHLKENSRLCLPPEVGGPLLEYGFGGGLHGGGEGFGCGLHLAAVLAGGEICKCAFYSGSPAGNIADGLPAVWAHIGPVDLKALDCTALACPVISECRGGCRYRAEVIGETDDCNGAQSEVYGKGCDFYKCFYYGIMK
jgi:radical SAM protein with 4Fe4S-binding SPASM domain